MAENLQSENVGDDRLGKRCKQENCGNKQYTE